MTALAWTPGRSLTKQVSRFLRLPLDTNISQRSNKFNRKLNFSCKSVLYGFSLRFYGKSLRLNWCFAKKNERNPLEMWAFTKTSGWKPTRMGHFPPNEWGYALCKITFNVIMNHKIIFIYIFADYLPTRFMTFIKNEWVLPHSKCPS